MFRPLDFDHHLSFLNFHVPIENLSILYDYFEMMLIMFKITSNLNIIKMNHTNGAVIGFLDSKLSSSIVIPSPDPSNMG